MSCQRERGTEGGVIDETLTSRIIDSILGKQRTCERSSSYTSSGPVGEEPTKKVTEDVGKEPTNKVTEDIGEEPTNKVIANVSLRKLKQVIAFLPPSLAALFIVTLSLPKFSTDLSSSSSPVRMARESSC